MMHRGPLVLGNVYRKGLVGSFPARRCTWKQMQVAREPQASVQEKVRSRMAYQRVTAGIAFKLGLLVCGVTLLAVGTVVVLTTVRFHDALVDREVRLLDAEAGEAAARLATSIDDVRHEVVFIERWPALNGMIRARLADGPDPESSLSERRWKQILQHAMLTLIEAKPDYLQVRIIGVDDGGRELVRVERDRTTGEVRLLSDDELQQKGHRPYFSAAASIEPGDTYVSPVEYNVGHGRGNPHLPVQRVATPIYAGDGRFHGIVVINLDVHSMCRAIAESLPSTHQLFIVNDDSIALVDASSSRDQSFPAVSIESIRAHVQAHSSQDEPASSSDRDRHILYQADGSKSFSVSRVMESSNDGVRTRFMVVAPYSEVVAAAVTMRNQCVVAGLLLLGLSLAFGGLMSNHIVRPLRQMVTAANRIAGGRSPGALPLDRRDEAGSLARAVQHMYDQVQNRTDQLQQEIAERKEAEAALEHANELLRQSNGDLQQFAYVASHDLQEPLRMVTSYLQLLERRYERRLDDDGREFIGYAVEGADRMRQLITDLLDFSRVDRSGRAHAPVDTGPLVQEVLADLKQPIEERGAILTVEGVAMVHADPVQLRQVLQNLISNAIKFCEQTPRVRISVHPTGDECVFAVQDNGIGIDPSFQDRIFVIFQRLNERSRFPGTGMGLAVVKRIVERHHGRIWIESTRGEGTTVYFTLPAAEEAVHDEVCGV